LIDVNSVLNSKPYNRIFEGIVPTSISRFLIQGKMPSEQNLLRIFPWFSLENKNHIRKLLERSLVVHAKAEPMKLQGLSTSEKQIIQKNGFHIVFYELLVVGDQHTSHDMVPFYGEKNCYLRKGAFTVRASIFSILNIPTQFKYLLTSMKAVAHTSRRSSSFR
jgi:hypothetical protein